MGKNNAFDSLAGVQAVRKEKGAALWPTVRSIHSIVLAFVISGTRGNRGYAKGRHAVLSNLLLQMRDYKRGEGGTASSDTEGITVF